MCKKMKEIREKQKINVYSIIYTWLFECFMILTFSSVKIFLKIFIQDNLEYFAVVSDTSTERDWFS